MTDRAPASNKISRERLAQVLAYDPDTGAFTWLVTLGAKRPKGSIAGSLTPCGYRAIHIDGQRYPAHWLAWFYVHGEWPAVQIDHINCERDDNRIANLRPCTKSENQQNRRPQANKHAPGVYRTGNRYLAKIWQPGGRRLYLGSYPSVEAAAKAYADAKRRLHPFAAGGAA